MRPLRRRPSVKQIATTRIQQLITASAIDATTLAALSGRVDRAGTADRQGSGRDRADAQHHLGRRRSTRLLALASPPVKADLAVVTPYANALLAANAAIPATDLARPEVRARADRPLRRACRRRCWRS